MSDSDSEAYLFSQVAVGVIGYSGGVVHAHPKFCEKVPCERVTVGQSECARVQHHLLADVKMENCVELVIIWGRQWDTLAMNKCSCDRGQQHINGKHLVKSTSYLSVLSVYFATLRDATVLILRLHHLYGVIFQVEVDLTLPDSVCLISSLGHSFLEVCFKTQSLEGQRDILRMRFIKLWCLVTYLIIKTYRKYTKVNASAALVGML